jgi:hypothetical protein
MSAALCYGSLGGGAQLAFHHQLGAYDTQTLIGALGELRRTLGGQKATLLQHPPRAPSEGEEVVAWSFPVPPPTASSRRVVPHTLMTVFPRACPSSRCRMASGTSRSG